MAFDIYWCGFLAMFTMMLVSGASFEDAVLASLLWFIALPGAALIKYRRKP